MFGQKEKKKTAAEIAKEGATKLGGFKKATETKDPVKGIQEYGKREMERQRKEAEEKKKKPATVETAPEDGFLSKMYKKYIGGKK